MLKEIIRNPVIIGLVAGTIVFAYLSWNRKKENERRLKKGKKIRDDDKYDDIIIPIIVAVLVWFIVYGYFNYNKENKQQTTIPNYKLVIDQPSEQVNQTFTLVTTGGITLPNTANAPQTSTLINPATVINPVAPVNIPNTQAPAQQQRINLVKTDRQTFTPDIFV